MKTFIQSGIIILLLCTFSIKMEAQKEKYNGYVITNQNDSIFGSLSLFPGKSTIKYCILKNSDGEKKYTSDNIRKFGFVNGYCYDTQILKDTILKILVQGKVSLYKSHSTFYVGKEDVGLFRLETFTNRVEKNGEMFYVEDIKWKGNIAFLTSDCSMDPEDLKKLRLMETDLTSYVVKYNTCTNSVYTEFNSQNEWSKASFGLVGGYYQSTLSVSNNVTHYYYTNQTYTELHPSIGAILKLTYPRISERFSNQLELNFSMINFRNVKIYEFQSQNEVYTYSFDFAVVSIPVIFNYSLISKKKNSLEIKGGGDIDFFIKNNANIIKQINGVNGSTTSQEDPYSIKNYHAGLVAGIGYQTLLNKTTLGIDLKYFYIVNSTFRPQFDLNTKKFAISLYVLFNKGS